MTDTWYSPGSIVFTPKQTLWILEHYDELRNGNWPVQAGSYVDPAIAKPSPSRHGPYEAAIIVHAEISRRLEDTGHDGAMVLMHYAYGQTVDAIARYFRLDERVVSYRMEIVLRRISRMEYRAGGYRRWNSARGEK